MRRVMVAVLLLAGVQAAAEEPESKPEPKAETQPEAKPKPKPEAVSKVAVMSMVPEKGVDKGTIRLLDEVILAEVQRTGRFDEIIGEQDIIAMLSLEETRVQLKGCADETCMAEIGGALGVEYLVAGRVGRVGERFVLGLKLLNVLKAKVAGRSNMITSPDETKLLAAARAAVREAVLGEQASAEVLEQLKAVEQPQPVVVATVPPPEDTSPSPVAVYGRWAALGLAVAAVGTAGAMAGLAKSDHTAMGDEVSGTPAWRDLKDTGETKALAADVMFGVAGAAAVTTVVLFLLARDKSDESETPPVETAVIPAGKGGFVTFGLRFR